MREQTHGRSEPKPSVNSPVVIIGAGPAGLTAAYELNKLGSRAVIIEADQQVGGLARTVNTEIAYREDGRHPDAQAGDRSIPLRHTAGSLSPGS